MTKCLVITVKDRAHRFESLRKDLEPLGLECIKLDAVDARTVQGYKEVEPFVPASVAFGLYKPRIKHMDINTKGSLGCFASHVKAWRSIAQSKEPCLVVEDDFVLNPKMDKQEAKTILANALDAIKRNVFDIVQMLNFDVLKANERFPRSIVRAITPVQGTYCVMISPRGAQKLLKHFRAIECHVDYWMGMVANVSAFDSDPLLLGAYSCQMNQFTEDDTTLHTVKQRQLVLDARDYEDMYSDYYSDPFRYDLVEKKTKGQTVNSDNFESVLHVVPNSQIASGTQKHWRDPLDRYRIVTWYNSDWFVFSMMGVLLLVIFILAVALGVCSSKKRVT